MIIFTIILATLVVFNILWGSLRNTRKSFFVVIECILSGIGALFLAKPVGRLLSPYINNVISEYLPSDLDIPPVHSIMDVVIPALSAVFLHVILFIILYLILKIPVAILSHKGKESSDDGKIHFKKNAASLILSGFNCLLFFFLTVAPVCGLVTLIYEDIDTVTAPRYHNRELRKQISNIEYTADVYRPYTADDPMVKFFSLAGGEKVYTLYTTFEYDGYDFSLHENVDSICCAFTELSPVINDDFVTIDKSMSESIRSTYEILFSSDFLKNTCYDCLDYFSERLSDNKKVFGYSINNVPYNFRDAAIIIVDYLAQSDESEKESFFTVLLDSIDIIAKYDLLRLIYESDEFPDELVDEELFTDIIRAVDTNVADLVSDVICNTFDVSEIFSSEYRNNIYFSPDTEAIVQILLRNVGDVDDSDAGFEGECIYELITLTNDFSVYSYYNDSSFSADYLLRFIKLTSSSELLKKTIHELSNIENPFNVTEFSSIEAAALLVTLLDEYYDMLSPSEQTIVKEVIEDYRIILGI